MNSLLEKFKKVRALTEKICAPLEKEDYVVQPTADVSPPKWHLGHTAWFFEAIILRHYYQGYKEFDKQFDFVFNSYYESVGSRVIRMDRGNLSRPSVDRVYHYRSHVDHYMYQLISDDPSPEVIELVMLGLNHEQQHQELLYTDIKYILGNNPLFPPYDPAYPEAGIRTVDTAFVAFGQGIYDIGFQGVGFAYDNELGRHKVYLTDFEIAADLVTNGEYLAFMEAGGYSDFRYWHAAGWDWVKRSGAAAPMYWYRLDGDWNNYTFRGLEPVDPLQPVNHVNYYEAYAFAAWKGARLPTEFEWEVASSKINWGNRWEWTESAYLPYPGFKKAAGAIGEYNGKFMVGQQVLRGASEITSPGHSRATYRNFFPAEQQWQFNGIRLARS